MKLLYRISTYLLPICMMAFSGCNNDEPFSVASPSDEPHILDPSFPDRVNGELPVVANINRDANFKMTLTVTPSQSTEVVWFIDGVEVAKGTEIDMPLLAGSYHMKVTATTTQGKSTYREGMINVNPLAGDPWASQISFERIVAPGSNAMLFGDNLALVKSMRIGNTEVTEIIYNEADGLVSYVVPADTENGTQRLVLIDAQGMEYGGNTVTVSSSPLITSGADRMTCGAECVLGGINLDRVSTLTLGGNDLTIVSKTDSEIKIICPDLEAGDYTIKGTSSDGSVQFFVNGTVVEETSVVVSSEQTLWSGHHYVSWDLEDGNPNKTFNLIAPEVFAAIKPGSILSIHYSVEPTAEYHQIRTTSGHWNDLPGTGTVEFSENGVLTVTLTAEALAMIGEQAGFLCVGHGYYVDLVTLR